jgi:DNA polymerase/3'-5' exonuclease PolX
MINSDIINEFEKLVNFIQQQLDSLTDVKLITLNTFRLKQIKNALEIIKKYPKQITNDNLKELVQFQGIGKGTIDRIKEIIKTGKLEEIYICKNISNENEKIIRELVLIPGIGRIGATKLLKNGVYSIDDLKNKIESGEIKVNDKIKIGVNFKKI